jgi:hypothetical protein
MKKRILALVLALTLALSVAACTTADAPQENSSGGNQAYNPPANGIPAAGLPSSNLSSGPERWEYHNITISYRFMDSTMESTINNFDEINSLGAEGWELVSITALGIGQRSRTHLFFKRRLP